MPPINSRPEACAPVREAVTPPARETAPPAVPYAVVRDVVAALRIANLASRASASAHTVAQAMSAADLDALQRHWPSLRPTEAVRAALDLAVTAGDVTISARPRGHPLFVHPEAVQRLSMVLGLAPSAPRRQRTRALVLEAARALGRAVRFCDIMSYRDESGWAAGLDRAAIGRDIQSLCRAGDVIAVREVLGGGVDGQYFYLPEEHAPGAAIELPVPLGPSTWLEHVLVAFQRCWEAECAEASSEQRRPRPISTGILRARLLEETELPQARDEKLVPNALIQLANASPPRVRVACVRTGSHFALWAPANVPDSSLDIGTAFASDAARVVEAAQRAIERLQVPAVSRLEVTAEIARDPALRPNGASSVAALLADASKAMIDAGTGSRRRRVSTVLHNVGCVAGEAHYTTRGGTESTVFRDREGDQAAPDNALVHAYRYIDLLRLRDRWRQRNATTQVQCASESLSAAASVGRLRAIRQGIEQLQAATAQLGADLAPHVRRAEREIEDIEGEAAAVSHECERHLGRLLIDARRLRAWTPALESAVARGVLESTGVTTETGPLIGTDRGEATLTTEEVFAMVRTRGYARAMRATGATELVPLLSHRIARLDNVEYAGWRQQASEYHFERTDAMLFAAIEWGGGTAVLFAQIARQELGQLRDPRFIRAGLSHSRFDGRMASAAALAFLPGDPETDDCLAQIALHDADAGVRRAALWAYGAAARPGVESLIERVLDAERHPEVVTLARSAQSNIAGVWWTI
jgi:chorismate-pyruvate lyase